MFLHVRHAREKRDITFFLPLWKFGVMSPPFAAALKQTRTNEKTYAFALVSNKTSPRAHPRDAPRNATSNQYLHGRPGPGGKKTTISTTGGKKFMSLDQGSHCYHPAHSQTKGFTDHSAATVTAPGLNKLSGAGLRRQNSIADSTTTATSNRISTKIGTSLRRIPDSRRDGFSIFF